MPDRPAGYPGRPSPESSLAYWEIRKIGVSNIEEVRYNCYVAINNEERIDSMFQPGELEQVKQDIAFFETEMDAGILGISDEEVHRRMREELPWLK